MRRRMRLPVSRANTVRHPGIDACLSFHRAYTGLRRRLDEELGTYHGIDFDDFALLHALSNKGGRSTLADIAAELGVSRSLLLRRLRPLEKIGLLAFDGGIKERHVALRAPGLSMIPVANDTVVRVCEKHATHRFFHEHGQSFARPAN